MGFFCCCCCCSCAINDHEDVDDDDDDDWKFVMYGKKTFHFVLLLFTISINEQIVVCMRGWNESQIGIENQVLIIRNLFGTIEQK